MSSPATYMLRSVIQRAQEGPKGPCYRVVAYPPPKGLSLRPAKFSSREQLVERLQTALPGFDTNLLKTTADTQIVFAQDGAVEQGTARRSGHSGLTLGAPFFSGHSLAETDLRSASLPSCVGRNLSADPGSS